MDPELDRCRRTDGKKWRCKKTAVPNQKYCDRHMHRGQQRPRKQTERNNKMPEYRGGIIPVSAQDNLSRSNQDRKRGIHQVDEDPRIHVGCNNQRISTDIKMHNTSSVVSEIPVSAQNLGQSQPDRKRGNLQTEEGKECSFENASPKMIDQSKTEKVKQPRFISPGFGSSPKSVLYRGAGKVELSLGPKNITERITPRCRRTDGKKWQCSRDALANQKYCQSHMHRGAKRAAPNPQYAIAFPRPSGKNINLNAIPKSPQNVGDNNSTSSASDATTITDENITLSLAQSLNC